MLEGFSLEKFEDIQRKDHGTVETFRGTTEPFHLGPPAPTPSERLPPDLSGGEKRAAFEHAPCF